MTLRLRPSGALRGELRPPGDKSISHRALICNVLAPGEARVTGFLAGEDCLHTLRCLQHLGATIERTGTTLRISSPGRPALRPTSAVLDCGNSGTSMRLLAGLAAGLEGKTVLDGDASLRSRPMDRVLEPLAAMGAKVAGDGTHAPITVRGGPLRPYRDRLPVPSAQVKSAILFAALAADGPSRLEETAPTRDHTEIMLRAMGAALDTHDGVVTLDPRAPLQPVDVEVPGDPSAAIFWLVAASIVPDSEVVLRNVCLNPTRTGALDVLEAMGARITRRNERRAGGERIGDLVVRAAGLRGCEIGGDLVTRAIDELPALAVAAALAHGPTTIRDAAELRLKESDRIAGTARLLRAFGAEGEERPDGLRIAGGATLQPGDFGSGGDHRLAMAAAVAALAAQRPGLSTLQGEDSVAVSYPEFWAHLSQLAGREALA